MVSSFGDDSAPVPSDGIKQTFSVNGAEPHALISGGNDSNENPKNTSNDTHDAIDKFYPFYLRDYIHEAHMIDIQNNYGTTHIAERAFLLVIDLKASRFY